MKKTDTSAVIVARGVVYTYFQNVVGVLTTLVYFPISVRILSQEEVGLTVMLGMILALVLILNSFSLPKAITKYVAENMGKRKLGVVSGLYKRSIQLSLGLGGISVVVFLLFYPVLFLYLPHIGLLPQLAILLSIDILISTSSGFLGSLLYGLQKFKEMTVIGTVSNVLRVSSIVVLLYLGHGVPGVVAGWIIGDLIGMTLYFFSTRKVVKAFTGEDEGVTTSKLFKYSMPLYGTSILDYLSTYIDRFLLLGLLGLSQLAIYSVAVTVSSFLVMISYPVSYVLFPVFSELYGKNDNKSLQIASLKATRYVSLIFVPMAVGLATVSYPVINIFTGAGYADATFPLAILCLTMSFTQVGVAIPPLLLALERTRIFLNEKILGIAVNTIMVLMLTPLIGIKGAALGRAGLFIVGLGYPVYVLIRSHSFYVDKEAFTKAWIGSLMMAIIVLIAQSYLFFDSKFILLYVLLGFVVYITTIRWLKLISYEDLLFIKRLLPKRFEEATGLFTRIFGIKSSNPREA